MKKLKYFWRFNKFPSNFSFSWKKTIKFLKNISENITISVEAAKVVVSSKVPMLYPILLVLEIILARLVVTTRVGLVWTSAHTRLVTEYALQDWFLNGIGIGYKTGTRLVKPQGSLPPGLVLVHYWYRHLCGDGKLSIIAPHIWWRPCLLPVLIPVLTLDDKFQTFLYFYEVPLFLQFQNIN